MVDQIELERAKGLIREFIVAEYTEGEIHNVFDNLEQVPIAYTSYETTGKEVEVYIDLKNYNITTYVNEEVYNRDSYATLKELNDYELERLNFDELVRI